MALTVWYNFDTAGTNQPLGFAVSVSDIIPLDIEVLTDVITGAPDIASLISVPENGASSGYTI